MTAVTIFHNHRCSRSCEALLERPIAIADNQRAVVGRPPEKVLEIL